MDVSSPWASYPGSADINCEALVANAARLRQYAPQSQHLAVVKADAYGHGRSLVARTLAESGYQIFGVAQMSEALALRSELAAAGRRRADIFSWILPPRDIATLREGLEAGIEVSVSSLEQLQMVRSCGLKARVHMKVDTGMGRAGVALEDLPALAREARQARSGGVEVVAVWSHLARADEVGEDAARATREQRERFVQACDLLEELGWRSLTRHLAATSGMVWHPETHFDMVRDGIGLYGLSPDPSHASGAELGFTPVMTLRASLSLVKRVRVGQSVSYGGTWTAREDTWLGIVPLGYGDGIPRHVSNRARVRVLGKGPIDAPVVGRICMDQFVVDLGAHAGAPARIGDEVILFSDPQAHSTRGCPSADDWARAGGTINYEIVTRIGARVPRREQG